MNTQNAELIEVATALLAALAFVVSLDMIWRSWRTWRDAVNEPRCEAVQLLAWLRMRNETLRALISLGVTYAGWVQSTSPLPPSPGPNRPIFQAIWLGIALICLTKSVLNERDSRRIVALVEQEREAGRMG